MPGVPGRIHPGLAGGARAADARRGARSPSRRRVAGADQGLLRVQVRRVDPARAPHDGAEHPALCAARRAGDRRHRARRRARPEMDHPRGNRVAMTKPAPAPTPKFCNECGAKLVADALFCHECGRSLDGTKRAAAAPASGMSNALKWGFPAFAVLALVALSVMKSGSRGGEPVPSDATPLGARPMQAPDISSMSPEEQADRLFNRVMRLSSEGKADSAAFFGTMAFGALEALAPLDAHRRYDMGLVALVMGDQARARA